MLCQLPLTEDHIGVMGLCSPPSVLPGHIYRTITDMPPTPPVNITHVVCVVNVYEWYIFLRFVAIVKPSDKGCCKQVFSIRNMRVKCVNNDEKYFIFPQVMMLCTTSRNKHCIKMLIYLLRSVIATSWCHHDLVNCSDIHFMQWYWSISMALYRVLNPWIKATSFDPTQYQYIVAHDSHTQWLKLILVTAGLKLSLLNGPPDAHRKNNHVHPSIFRFTLDVHVRWYHKVLAYTCERIKGHDTL